MALQNAVSPLIHIERGLVGWFEAGGFHVEHDGHEWFAWVGDRMLPLTEIAVVIKLELESTD